MQSENALKLDANLLDLSEIPNTSHEIDKIGNPVPTKNIDITEMNMIQDQQQKQIDAPNLDLNLDLSETPNTSTEIDKIGNPVSTKNIEAHSFGVADSAQNSSNNYSFMSKIIMYALGGLILVALFFFVYKCVQACKSGNDTNSNVAN